MLFAKAGPENTQATLEAALSYAREHGISTLVVASTTGKTGAVAADMARQHGVAVIVVTHNAGFREPGAQELASEYRKRIESAGGRIHTGTLVLRGLGAAIRGKLGNSDEALVATVLRMFGQGMKVCVEMAAMVSDAGLISTDDIVSVAGTAAGADTAVVISPAPSNRFFDTKVRSVIAKPRDF